MRERQKAPVQARVPLISPTEKETGKTCTEEEKIIIRDLEA
jgi:hypothetical protein